MGAVPMSMMHQSYNFGLSNAVGNGGSQGGPMQNQQWNNQQQVMQHMQQKRSKQINHIYLLIQHQTIYICNPKYL